MVSTEVKPPFAIPPEMKARANEYPTAQGTEFGMNKAEKLRSSILRRANEIICKDRAATHGEAEDSFACIAAYWSVYLTQKTGSNVTIMPLDVAMMMDLFKTARIHNNPTHMDNWLDKAGYSALAGEIALTKVRAAKL